MRRWATQGVRKGIPIRKARETGEAFERFPIGWQGVGLLVANHLQAVFHGAQKSIGGVEIVAYAVPDPAPIGQHVQRPQCLLGRAIRDAARRQ